MNKEGKKVKKQNQSFPLRIDAAELSSIYFLCVGTDHVQTN